MSEENVELLRRIFASYAQGEFRPDLLAPEIVWKPADEAAMIGPKAVVAYMERWESEWDDLRTEAEEFLDAGDKILVTVHFSGRGRRSGIQVAARSYELFEIRGGKIVRMDEFVDRAEALEAAGISG